MDGKEQARWQAEGARKQEAANVSELKRSVDSLKQALQQAVADAQVQAQEAAHHKAATATALSRSQQLENTSVRCSQNCMHASVACALGHLIVKCILPTCCVKTCRGGAAKANCTYPYTPPMCHFCVPAWLMTLTLSQRLLDLLASCRGNAPKMAPNATAFSNKLADIGGLHAAS